MARFLVSTAQKMKGVLEDMVHRNDLGEDDGCMWYNEGNIHAFGKISCAAVKANSCMEDYCQVEIGHKATFIGVYDGHGGHEASKFVSEHLFPNFIDAANEDGFIESTTLERAVKKTCTQFAEYVDQNFRATPEIATVGSSCLAAVIWGEKLIVANLGDSRAILGVYGPKKDDDVHSEPITQDQSVSLEEVRRQVQHDNPGDEHILVMDPADGTWRIRGISQVSRSIGDECLKRADFALGPQFGRFHLDPPLTRPALRSDVVMTTRTFTWNDHYIVFGSRGLWEHLTDEKVLEIVSNAPKEEVMARTLIREALKAAAKKGNRSYWSLRAAQGGEERRAIHDDITVIVVLICPSLILRENVSHIGRHEQVSIQRCSFSTNPSDFVRLNENVVPPPGRYSELEHCLVVWFVVFFFVDLTCSLIFLSYSSYFYITVTQMMRIVDTTNYNL